MTRNERRHVERMARGLLEEHGSAEAAVAMAERLAGSAKENGREMWLMVAAELKTTHAQVQHAE
jgi:hypothetical protein